MIGNYWQVLKVLYETHTSLSSIVFTFRISRPEVFCKKNVLRSLTKFTEKHLCQSLFFNKIAGLRPATLFKKETLAHVFSCESCKIFKNTFFTENLWTTASNKLWGLIPLKTISLNIFCLLNQQLVCNGHYFAFLQNCLNLKPK